MPRGGTRGLVLHHKKRKRKKGTKGEFSRLFRPRAKTSKKEGEKERHVKAHSRERLLSIVGKEKGGEKEGRKRVIFIYNGEIVRD